MPAGFVRVSNDGSRLEEDSRPFCFAGANVYYLLTRAADPNTRHECVAALDAAAAAGLTVIRSWAFADGEQWGALQPAPGVFDERVFAALDWVLVEAARRRLRLLLGLTNYWPDYGGMRQYVAWAAARRGEPPPRLPGGGTALDAVPAERFYGDPDCQAMFQAFLAALVGRKNSLSGVAYRDDPTILAWSIANEPHCAGDAACCTVAFWADSTARFLKSLDPNHLVTVDVEGFLGPSTPHEAAAANPYDCSASGCDFAAECASPAIDLACCHLYPDLWLPNAGEQDRLRFALRWLDCHVALARRLGKSLVLSEWGKQRSGGSGRAAYCAELLGGALRHMERGGLAGTANWVLAAPTYADHDGFTIYLSGPSSGSRTAAAVRQHAAAVLDLNTRLAAHPPQAAVGPSHAKVPAGGGAAWPAAPPSGSLPAPQTGASTGPSPTHTLGSECRGCLCSCRCPIM